MNCNNVEELLPLYIGGDLDEKRARLLTEHVQSCVDCSRSAQEYAEANQMLQAFEPPQFGEATFAAIRSQVLREIETEIEAETEIARKFSSSQLFQLFVRPFQSRITWAVSTAVVLAVCLFAYYFVASRTGPQQREHQRAANRGAVDKRAPVEQANAETPNHNSGRTSAPTGTASVAGSPAGQPRWGAVSPAPAAAHYKTRLRHTARHSQRAGETPAVPVTTVPNLPTLESAAPTTLATVDKALRLEIQTSDQNIRIIWFSHPSNNESSPKEVSKGT